MDWWVELGFALVAVPVVGVVLWVARHVLLDVWNKMNDLKHGGNPFLKAKRRREEAMILTSKAERKLKEIVQVHSKGLLQTDTDVATELGKLVLRMKQGYYNPDDVPRIIVGRRRVRVQQRWSRGDRFKYRIRKWFSDWLHGRHKETFPLDR